MIETLRIAGSRRDIVLLHGVSYDYDLAWRQELTELEQGDGFPLRYVATVSRPQACPTGPAAPDASRRSSTPARRARAHARDRHDLPVRQPGDDHRGRGDRRGPRLPAGAGAQGAVLAEGPEH